MTKARDELRQKIVSLTDEELGTGNTPTWLADQILSQVDTYVKGIIGDVELRGDTPDFIEKPEEWLQPGVAPSFTYLNMRAIARELQRFQRQKAGLDE